MTTKTKPPVREYWHPYGVTVYLVGKLDDDATEEDEQALAFALKLIKSKNTIPKGHQIFIVPNSLVKPPKATAPRGKAKALPRRKKIPQISKSPNP